MGKTKLATQLNPLSAETYSSTLQTGNGVAQLVLGGSGSTGTVTQANNTITPNVTTPSTDPATTVVTSSNTGTTTSTGGGTSTSTTTPTNTTATGVTTTTVTPFYEQLWFWAVCIGVIGTAAYIYFTKIKK